MSGTDARVEELQALLAEAGIPGSAAVAGFRQEVAVVATGAAHLAAVEALSQRIRALGFRYVTVDLETLARADA
ncbi:MAG: hypothetical protein WEB88_17190 [Gemmatimonadota bacterium]